MEVEKKRISGVDGPAVVRDVAITRFNYLQLYNSIKQTREKKNSAQFTYASQIVRNCTIGFCSILM